MECEGDVCLPAGAPKAEAKAPERSQDPRSAPDGRRQIKVECISDVIWPWCYVGQKRLEDAVAKLDQKKYKVELVWRPFELDPTLPTASKVKLEHYYAKFGKQRCDQMLPEMKKTGKAHGIAFSYGGKIGNTLNAHRLVERAKQQGKQGALMAVLFRFYFEQERDIADLPTLAEAAVQVGLGSSDDILAFLKSDELRGAVKEDIERAYGEGVSGVPYFIVDDKYALSGAQPAEAWAQVFKQALSK